MLEIHNRLGADFPARDHAGHVTSKTMRIRGNIMMVSTETFDADAMDFAEIPAWFDRHPSQAEGADI